MGESHDARQPWLLFKSAGEFRGVQRRLDDMSGQAVSRLLPQYETLVRNMRLRVNEWAREHRVRPWSRLLASRHRNHRHHDATVGTSAGSSVSSFVSRTPAKVARIDDDNGDLPAELLPVPSLRRSLTHAPIRSSQRTY